MGGASVLSGFVRGGAEIVFAFTLSAVELSVLAIAGSRAAAAAYVHDASMVLRYANDASS